MKFALLSLASLAASASAFTAAVSVRVFHSLRAYVLMLYHCV